MKIKKGMLLLIAAIILTAMLSCRRTPDDESETADSSSVSEPSEVSSSEISEGDLSSEDSHEVSEVSSEDASSKEESSGPSPEPLFTQEEADKLIEYYYDVHIAYDRLINCGLEIDRSVSYFDEVHETMYYLVTELFYSKEDVRNFLEKYFVSDFAERRVGRCFDYLEMDPPHYRITDGKLYMADPDVTRMKEKLCYWIVEESYVVITDPDMVVIYAMSYESEDKMDEKEFKYYDVHYIDGKWMLKGEI